MKTNLTEQEKWAYMAGIIDGEGCLRIRSEQSSSKYRCEIVVVNTNKRVIDWLLETLGGNVQEISNAKQPSWKKAYGWHLQYPEAIEKLIRNIYPYLLIKLDQAQTMMFFLSRDVLDSGEKWYLRMKALNKKGVPDGSS